MPETIESYYARHANKYDTLIDRGIPELSRIHKELGSRLPADAEKILNLGGGTGNELKSVFRRFPNLYVDIIDISSDMIRVLLDKYPSQDIRIICQNYSAVEFQSNFYDTCVAINSLNTLLYDDKMELFYRIYDSLQNDGLFIYFDRFAQNEDESDIYAKAYYDALAYEEICRGRAYNFYLPLTIESETALLEEVGFKVEVAYIDGNFALLMCHCNIQRK